MNLTTTGLFTTAGMLMATVAAAQGGAGQEQEDGEFIPMLERGTQELSLSGTLDLPDLDELDYDIEGSYGYFFRDGWEAGVAVSAADLGGQDRIEVGAFTEYNFRRNQTLVPYVGGGLGIISADFGDDVVLGTPIDDEDGLVFNVEGGVKFFLRRYMAISASIAFKVSTEDVFETDEAIEDSLNSIRIGMRYYF